eukprot:16428105-Heterocapsa_arctica.AAC.1
MSTRCLSVLGAACPCERRAERLRLRPAMAYLESGEGVRIAVVRVAVVWVAVVRVAARSSGSRSSGARALMSGVAVVR